MPRTKSDTRKWVPVLLKSEPVRVRQAGDLEDEGRLFVSIDTAAITLGLSIIMINFHLMDRQKYPTVEGYVFEWANDCPAEVT